MIFHSLSLCHGISSKTQPCICGEQDLSPSSPNAVGNNRWNNLPLLNLCLRSVGFAAACQSRSLRFETCVMVLWILYSISEMSASSSVPRLPISNVKNLDDQQKLVNSTASLTWIFIFALCWLPVHFTNSKIPVTAKENVSCILSVPKFFPRRQNS